MRKRNIISCILTMLLLIATCQFWLVSKPMHVSFLFKGNGDYNFVVQLNKRNDSEFKHISECVFKKHLTGDFSYCECNVDIKNVKRFKLIVDASNKSPVEIKDILLKHGRVRLSNPLKLAYSNAFFGGGGLIEPSEHQFSIVYDEPLNVRSSVKFEFLTFLIILILGYLLAYKVTSYLADFKVEKHYSRVDILFLVACIIILFIPMSNISDAKKSDTENRNLAVWKPFIDKKEGINYNFGRDFDSWFNDRFNLRSELLAFNDRYLHLFNNVADYYETEHAILEKNTGFMFTKKYNSLGMYLRTNLYTQAECEKIKATLTNLQAYFKANDVKLYILLSNDKESIYPELYPKYYIPRPHKSRQEQLVEIISSIDGLGLIYPKEKILDAKNDGNFIFLKGDTHYSPYGECARGSLIEYMEIINTLSNDFLIKDILTTDDFTTEQMLVGGDIFDQLKSLNLEEELVEVFRLKNPKAKVAQHSSIREVNDVLVINNHKVENSLKVVMIGDSFHTRYRKFLGENFNKFISLFFGDGRPFILDDELKLQLFSEKPDILILESTERFLDRFLYLDSFNDVFEEKYRSVK